MPFEAGHDLDRMQREIMDKDRRIEELQWKLCAHYEDLLEALLRRQHVDQERQRASGE